MDFKGKNAVVTGSSGGIGAAAAIALAKEGADIILASRNMANLQKVKQEIEALGRKAVAIECDVSKDESVTAMRDKALEAFGNIDILINNAAVGVRGLLEDISLDDWQYIINTNLLGYIRNVNAFLPHFMERGSGYIVNVSSVQGIGYMPDQLNVAYITTKAGIIGFSTVIHGYLKQKGIKVSCLIPGAVKTEIATNSRYVGPPERVKEMLDQAKEMYKIPIFLTPEAEADGLIEGMKKEEFLIFVPANMLQMFKAQGLDMEAYNNYVANPPPMRMGPPPKKE
ncbi:MAG: SDR family NAD(P)-dependent oxidoreductase [Dehalococcoidales bacterium]|nr:SDR family NAD(P)-dependent oxidoreductase [Dehalococcoidales bacterium]